MLNYKDALEWIHSREKFKVKPGLKRMSWMMEKLGRPELKFEAVHVAGTNGKGSTVSFLRHLLQEQGYRIGTFTSPYIIRFNERISLNGEPISDQELAALTEKIRPLAEELGRMPLGEPTEFEIITAMAMLYFADSKLDYVIFETGLGGRYDSTNIIQPIISVITNIGKDHVNILGNTYEEIAVEKAGIIKSRTPVISGVQQPEAKSVIGSKAREMQAPLTVLYKDFYVNHLNSSAQGEHFYFYNKDFHSEELLSSMMGAHQVENASLALQTVEVMKQMGKIVDRSRYKEGIHRTSWPARFEIIEENPAIIIDGAHNVEGTLALVNTLKNHYKGKKIFLLYAALEDKPVTEMLEQLKEVIDEAWFTSFDFPRALTGEELCSHSPLPYSHVSENPCEAIESIIPNLHKEDVFLITGSLYFISKIREYFESNERL